MNKSTIILKSRVWPPTPDCFRHAVRERRKNRVVAQLHDARTVVRTPVQFYSQMPSVGRVDTTMSCFALFVTRLEVKNVNIFAARVRAVVQRVLKVQTELSRRQKQICERQRSLVRNLVVESNPI